MRARWILGLTAGLLPLLLGACATYDNAYYVHSVWRAADAKPAAARVYYVTDRLADGTPGGFGYRPGKSASCGTVDAAIPAAKRPGDHNQFAATVKPVSVSCARDGAPFGGLVAKIAAETPACRRVLIFVHGYNTGFETAALRTAQLKSDAQFACAAIAFSWSSAGQRTAYKDDRVNAERAEPLLAALVAALNGVGIEPEIVAHSMGTRLTLRALAGGGGKIGELLLFAADVGDDEFQALVSKVSGRARRITIYASADDAVLAASERLNGGPRLGEQSRHALRYRHRGDEGIDTIDASDAAGDLSGHNYFGLSYEAVADMSLALAGVPAAARAAPLDGRAPTLTCPLGSLPQCEAQSLYALNVTPERGPSLPWQLLRWLSRLIPVE